MKPSYLVLLGAVAALPFGFYLTHRAGNPPAVDTTSVPQPAPMAKVSAATPLLRVSSNEEPGASPTVADSDRTADGTHKEMAALRGEVALLRAEISTLQQQMDAQWQAAPVAAPGGEEDPASDPRNDPAARAEADRHYQEQIEAIEANFWQEPTDPQWSSEAALAVQEALASDETAWTGLRNIECRSYTCRVEIADDNTGQLAKLMPLFAHQLAQTLPNVTANQVDEGNGTTTMILYMSSETNEPPRNGG